jgi:endonuclease/exonuclease/phosphatase (EEP) superfamily protein YafD
MGDFNLPVESAIYRANWAGFTNAFSQQGLGFGYTKHTRWHGIRIDHVLARSGWDIERAWVGPSAGGDHLPVIVELHLLGR